MDWSELKGIVSKGAPIVGTLLGGPAGAAVGGLISMALGTDNSADAVSAALLGNPDAMVKIQELQTTARVELQQIAAGVEVTRMQEANKQYAEEVEDRDSARSLAAKQPNDWVRPAITVIMILGAIAIIAAVFSGMSSQVIKDPTESMVAGTIIGYWFNEVKQVLAFWFGMTRDAQTQNQAITAFAVSPGTVSTPPANATTTTVSTPVSAPQAVTVTPAPPDEQPYVPTPGAQGSIYQGS